MTLASAPSRPPRKPKRSPIFEMDGLMPAVKALSRIRFHRSLGAIAFDVALIAACAFAASRHPHPAVMAVAGIIIASRQHALLILMHEGAHFRLHPRRFWNDLVSDLLLAFPLMISTDGYRRHHLAHHAYLNSDDDPDWTRKLADANWDLPKTKWTLLGVLLRDLCGGGVVDQIRSIGRLKGMGRKAAQGERRAGIAAASIRVAYYALAAAVVTRADAWIPVLLLWFLPAFTILPVILRVRSVAEHFGVPADADLNSSRNYGGPWWERFFFAPHNVGYHLDHHLFPSVPFYHLPALNRFLNRHPHYRRLAHQNDSLFKPTPFSVMSDVTLGSDAAENARKQTSALNRSRRAVRAAAQASSEPIEEPRASRCPYAALWNGGTRDGRARRVRFGSRKPPGPKGWPFLGSLPAYLADAPAFLTRLSKSYGDVVSFRIGRRWMVAVNDPTLIETMMNRDHAAFQKTGLTLRARPILGDGLITSEGERHRAQRRRAQPAFSGTALHLYAEQIPSLVADETRTWRAGDERDLADEMTRLSLRIAGRTLFGAEIGPSAPVVGTAVEALFDYFDRLLLPGSRLWERLPLPKVRRSRAALKTVHALVDALIDAQLKQEKRAPNLLGIYLTALENDPAGGLNRKEIRDQVMTFLMAGHETVATALGWTWHLLTMNPRAADRFYDEIDRVVGSAPPTAEALDRLAYTDAVVKESMRLYPPVWNLTREATVDIDVGAFRIPAGTIIGMSPFVVQRDPRYFAEPLEFRPERWDAARADARPRFSYFPFGGGPRRCIGAGFATMEMKLILATLAQSFRFQPMPAPPIGYKPFITLRPNPGIRVTVQRRTGREAI